MRASKYATALVFASLLGLAQRAEAQQVTVKSPEAQKHLSQGITFYNALDYDRAVAEFQAGYEVEQNPQFLFLVGQAERASGDCDKAIKAYTAFLASDPTGDLLTAAQSGVAKCKAKPAQIPPPAAPTTAPLAPAAQPVEAPPSAPPPFYRNILGDALAGVGVAGIAVGATFLVLGNSAASGQGSATTSTDFDSQRSTASTDHTIAVVGLAAGGALLAGGLVVYLLLPPHQRDETVALTPLPGGGAFAFMGSF